MPKRRKRGKGPSGGSYARLTKHEWQTIERALDRYGGCHEIARKLDAIRKVLRQGLSPQQIAATKPD